jgi:hypothetical protein
VLEYNTAAQPKIIMNSKAPDGAFVLYGKYKVLHNVGNARDSKGVGELMREGELWIKKATGVQQLDFANEKEAIVRAMDSIESLELIGLELLLGKLFDEVGFNEIADEIFKQLVIYRIAFSQKQVENHRISVSIPAY